MENQINPSNQPNAKANWFGPFYFAREDERVFVPKRFGYGLTLNFARPMAFGFLAFLFLVPTIVMILLICTR